MGILQYRADNDTNKIIASKMIFGMQLASVNFNIRCLGDILPKWQTSIFNYEPNNLLREMEYTDTIDEMLEEEYLTPLPCVKYKNPVKLPKSTVKLLKLTEFLCKPCAWALHEEDFPTSEDIPCQ
jgi:hypothetical protein